MPNDNEIRLPVDLPGYDESIRKLNEIIDAIQRVQSQKSKMVKAEKALNDAYGQGQGSWQRRKRDAAAYYVELKKVSTELDKLKGAEGSWAQYVGGWKGFKGAMRQEDEMQRLHSMSWRLEGSKGLGMSFKGIKSPARWGGIPKPEASRMKDLSSAASAGFWEKDFTNGLNKATGAQQRHRSASDQASRSIGIEARRFKWMLGFVLMGTNALKKLTGESKVFSSLWGLMGKAFGFILDMIIIPLAPYLIWIAEGLFAIGMFINDINTAATDVHPVLGAFLAILEIITGAAIVVGLVNITASFLGMESAALAASGASALLGIALKGLLALGAILLVIKIADDTGVADHLAKVYWVAFNTLKGMYWEYTSWLAQMFEAQYIKVLEWRDAIYDLAREIHETMFGWIPGFGGGSVGGRRGDGSTQMSYSRVTSNPYLEALGLGGYDSSMGDPWKMVNARWDELYPGGWTTYGDQFDSFGYTGRPEASAPQNTTVNNLTVNEMNIGIDPTDFNAIMDEANRRSWENANRASANYW